MVELADTAASKTAALWREGSSPSGATKGYRMTERKHKHSVSIMIELNPRVWNYWPRSSFRRGNKWIECDFSWLFFGFYVMAL